MKKMLCLLLAVLVFLGLCGCGSGPEMPGYELKVTVSSWNGWEPDYEPEEQQFVYAVKKDKHTLPDVMTGEMGFSVAKIGEDSIEIKTSEALAVSGQGGADFSNTQKAFTVNAGEPLRLITATMDAGTVYLFELVKKAGGSAG